MVKKLLSLLLLVLVMVAGRSGPAASLVDKPQRVVSINLCTDELLYRLADREHIAAVSVYSEHQNSSAVYEEVRGMPKTRGELEEILSFSPDLVIGSIFSSRTTFEMLEQLGIPTMTLRVPERFEDIYSNLRKLGDALGERDKADAMIFEMRKTLERSRARKENRVGVFYQSGGNIPGMRTFQNAILEASGLENLASQKNLQGHGHLSLEELVMQKPDVLIFSDAHYQKTSVGHELLFHPVIDKALPEAKKITLPSKYIHCGAPSSIKAVELLNESLVSNE